VGVVAVTAGGLLVGGAVVVALLRDADIQSLVAACPNGVCPSSKKDELVSKRSRALAEGPVAIGLGVGGGVAAAVGLYLLLAPRSKPATSLVPWVDRTGSGLAVQGSF
jgi:hypothetical protein